MYKTLDKLKEELGANFGEFIYNSNLELLKENEDLQHAYNTLWEENKDLQQRIDKAIEYINNTSYFDGSSMCANDLLEILEVNNE